MRTQLCILYCSLLLGLATAAPARAGQAPTREIVSVGLSRDGHLAAAAYNDQNERGLKAIVKVWDTGTGREVSSYADSGEERVTAAAFSPDGKLLAVTVTRKAILLIDPLTGSVVRTLNRSSNPERPPLYLAVAFRADGAQLAGAAEDGLYLFDTASGRELPGPSTSRNFGVAYRPDGGKLAFGSGSLEIWEPGTEYPKKFDRNSALPVFSKTGKYLSVSDPGEGTMTLLDGSTFAVVAKLDPNAKELRNLAGVALCPDENLLVAATRDGLAFFKLPSLLSKTTWNGTLTAATAVAFAADGNSVLSGHKDGVVRLVDATGDKARILREFGVAVGDAAPAPRALAGTGDETKKSADGNIGTPPPPGSEALIAAVESAAAAARHPPGYGTDPTPYGKRCMEAVAKALASHIPDTAEAHIAISQDIPGTRKQPDSGFRYIPLRIVNSAICIPAVASGYLSTVSTSASRACTWIGKMKNPNGAYGKDLKDGNLLKMAVNEGKGCLAAVAEARKAGVPDTASVEFFPYGSGIESPLSLGALEAQVCKVALGGMSDLKQKDDARVAALYAPYLNVLSGDKAQIFKDEKMLIGTSYYGPHMKLLKSPADFKAAHVWYWYSYDRNIPLRPRWNVSGYIFSGNKKTGSHSKSGAGMEPPASAFP